MSAFYLMQRLALRDQRYSGLHKGFDRYFELDYMGSSEFEWGAVPAALRSIRSSGPLEVTQLPRLSDGQKCDLFMVAAPAVADEKAAAFTWWATDARHPFYGKEATGLDIKLFGGDDWRPQIVAWWSLEDDVAITTDRTVADLLITAFAPAEVAA